MTCADEPQVAPRPNPSTPRTDAEKTEHAKGLRTSWADCYDTVGAIRTRREAYVEQYEKGNFNAVERVLRSLQGKKGER